MFRNYGLLTQGLGVARGKQILNKKMENKFRIFFAYNTQRPPMGVHKKFQPNRSSSSRLADYTQHIYECPVLLYRYS